MFGITQQAYYQYFWREIDYQLEEELLIQEVRTIRKRQPMIGTRKLYEILMVKHQIIVSRDSHFDLLAENGMLVRRKKRKAQTTFSAHWLRKYPNLIKGIEPKKPNQVWVADIIYLETEIGFVYISLVTDATQQKCRLSYDCIFLAISLVEAFKMALVNITKNLENLIHHSDRGGI